MGAKRPSFNMRNNIETTIGRTGLKTLESGGLNSCNGKLISWYDKRKIICVQFVSRYGFESEVSWVIGKPPNVRFRYSIFLDGVIALMGRRSIRMWRATDQNCFWVGNSIILDLYFGLWNKTSWRAVSFQETERDSTKGESLLGWGFLCLWIIFRCHWCHPKNGINIFWWHLKNGINIFGYLEMLVSASFFLRDIYQDAGARDTDKVGPQAAAAAKLHNCTCSMVVHKFN